MRPSISTLRSSVLVVLASALLAACGGPLRYAPKGKHMAFEALPEKAERLRRKFPDVQIVQGAVGERPGEITFYRDLTSSGCSGMTSASGWPT